MRIDKMAAEKIQALRQAKDPTWGCNVIDIDVSRKCYLVM